MLNMYLLNSSVNGLILYRSWHMLVFWAKKCKLDCSILLRAIICRFKNIPASLIAERNLLTRWYDQLCFLLVTMPTEVSIIPTTVNAPPMIAIKEVKYSYHFLFFLLYETATGERS